jgi:hypothetical protein
MTDDAPFKIIGPFKPTAMLAIRISFVKRSTVSISLQGEEMGRYKLAGHVCALRQVHGHSRHAVEVSLN